MSHPDRPNVDIGDREVAAHHQILRTQPMGARSGPGDVDLTVYGLRKFLRLALNGNPTILIPLYAVGDAVVLLTPLGAELRELAPKLVSRAASRRFLGYLDARRRAAVEGAQPARAGRAPWL